MTSRFYYFALLSLAGDRSADSDHARRSVESLKSDLDHARQGRDRHYARTWTDFCAKHPAHGGCDTVLRRLSRSEPHAKTSTELQRGPSVEIRDAKAR